MKEMMLSLLFCLLCSQYIISSQARNLYNDINNNGDYQQQVGTPIIPTQYPLFKQCDPRWANNTMGGNNPHYDTICIQGCAMSSVSMALHGKGFTLNNGTTEINPGTLNKWLQNHSGYTCINENCNNLVLDSPNKIDPQKIHFISEAEKPSASTIATWVINKNPVAIAHVRNKSHFVLIVGIDTQDSDKFYVNDPFFSVNSYTYEQIADIITYTIKDN